MNARAITLSGIVVLMTVACDSHVAICTEVSLSELAQDQWGAQEWPESWPDRSISCAIGEYVVLTPAAGSDVEHVMLLRKQEPMFVHQGGASMVFENRRPLIDASDTDGDGAFDQVSYSTYRDEQWDRITVIDRNLDGQADMRKYGRSGAREDWLWVEDGWYQTPRLGSMEVLVNGTAKPYMVVNGRFVFGSSAGEGRITNR